MCSLSSSRYIDSLSPIFLPHPKPLSEFGQAEAQFERILALDPYRIDDIDVFSNILYVTDNRLKLSKLAHEFLALDKDRPEICCLVGTPFHLSVSKVLIQSRKSLFPSS